MKEEIEKKLAETEKALEQAKAHANQLAGAVAVLRGLLADKPKKGKTEV